MSDDLIAFLKAWHDWATNGAPDGQPFKRAYGLCGNSHRDGVNRELDELFEYDSVPFGMQNYLRRSRNATQHECPKRLAWVRSKLVEAGELVA